MQDFQARGLAAWDAFQASRRRPYPTAAPGRRRNRGEAARTGGTVLYVQHAGEIPAFARWPSSIVVTREEVLWHATGIRSSTPTPMCAAEILTRYLTAQEQAKLTSWEPYKVVQRRTGHVTYPVDRAYRRRLGLADADTSAASTGYMAGFTGAHKGQDPSPLVDADPAARIKDMDLEGVDVNLTLPSGWFGTWTLSEDPRWKQ